MAALQYWCWGSSCSRESYYSMHFSYMPTTWLNKAEIQWFGYMLGVMLLRSLTSIAQWLPPTLMTKMMHSWLTVSLGCDWMSILLFSITKEWFHSHLPTPWGYTFITLLLEFSEELRPQNKDLFASLIFNSRSTFQMLLFYSILYDYLWSFLLN